MFLVDFIQDFGAQSYYPLSAFSRVVSLSGFDALSYNVFTQSNGHQMVPSSFSFRQQPFSIVLFVSASSRQQFREYIATIQTAFRQYRSAKLYHLVVIYNQETGVTYYAPVLVEAVTISQQTGLSATVTITGVRRTLGLFVGFYQTITASANASGLPKTVTINYPYSFPAPLRIELYGPISAGFQISRNDGLPNFDFTLTVGTSIPSGVTVRFEYRLAFYQSSDLIYNPQYLANPEIAPDVVIRPQPVTGSPTNTFTLSGPSSSGSVGFLVHPMSWSIYE